MQEMSKIVDAHGGIVVEFIGNSAANTKLLLGIAGAFDLESFATLNGLDSGVEISPFNLCGSQIASVLAHASMIPFHLVLAVSLDCLWGSPRTLRLA